MAPAGALRAFASGSSLCGRRAAWSTMLQASSTRAAMSPAAIPSIRASPRSAPPPVQRFYSTRAETKGYKFNHTMIRIRDPEKSLHFYQEILGMELINEHDAGDFKLFFLAFPDSPSANAASQGQREGILELTWNKGTEKDPKFSGYHNGNDEPQGFGHTCVSVPNLQEACDRFEKMGVKFRKRPQDGKMRHIAFLLDPDSYSIEVIELGGGKK